MPFHILRLRNWKLKWMAKFLNAPMEVDGFSRSLVYREYPKWVAEKEAREADRLAGQVVKITYSDLPAPPPPPIQKPEPTRKPAAKFLK
jgi:hypothetical protein